MINKNSKRFYDEGENFWPKRYAIWGRLIAQQPDQIAYSILDEKLIDLFMPSVFPAEKANSISQLAIRLGLEPSELGRTVSKYNSSIHSGTFDPATLEGCCTKRLEPAKSNWA